MKKTARVRLPENRPNEVSILHVASKWRVFVRQQGRFAVTPFDAESEAIAYAQAECARVGLQEPERIVTHF